MSGSNGAKRNLVKQRFPTFGFADGDLSSWVDLPVKPQKIFSLLLGFVHRSIGAPEDVVFAATRDSGNP
jgi:hypothetical protein